jgi:hypothetical protein
MAERRTRGKPSSIEMLPEDIKQLLDEMLRDKKVTQKAIVDAVNAKLAAAGIPDEITKSSLNRYSTNMETVGGRIRDAREIAEVWTAKLGDKPTGDVSNLLIEMLRSIAFETTMRMTEGDDPVSPGLIKELALGIQRLENAAMLTTKREKEIRQAFAQQAAAAIEKKTAGAGMSRTTIDEIKKEILGIA